MQNKKHPFNEFSLKDLQKTKTGLQTMRGIFIGFLLGVSIFLIYLVISRENVSVAAPVLILITSSMVIGNILFGKKLKGVEKELESRKP
ncbi:MAG: hypothetical protein AAF824_14785 [Bacteroidota bacterium]